MNHKTNMTLAVFGLGHVGLPTALGFADLGWNVIGVDSDRSKVESLTKGHVPFFEDGVDSLLKKHLKSDKFVVTSDSNWAVNQADILFICVATPQYKDGSADISQIENLAYQLRDSIKSYKIVIQKSTTPVNTAEKIRIILSQPKENEEVQSADKLVDVVVIPEFLREGKAIEDFFNPQRIVVGLDDMSLKETIINLYMPLFQKIGKAAQDLMIFTDTRSAEISKNAANSFLATKLSFINMVSDLCLKVGANIDSVSRSIGADPRIGTDFLKAGIGFGGECLPKDLNSFIDSGKTNGVNFSILEEVQKVNDNRVNVYLSQIKDTLPNLKDMSFAVWGLAFKPNTDEIRNSPAINIINKLIEEHAKLRLYDPLAMPEFKNQIKTSELISFASDPIDAAVDSNGVLILTDWPQFKEQDLSKLFQVMKTPIIFDGRNMLDRNFVTESGFQYYGLGV